MKDTLAKRGVDELREAYATAVLAFSAASSVLVLKLAVNSLPTDEQITMEENARAAVIAARRKVWAGQQPASEIFALILPGRVSGGEWARLRETYTRALLKHAESASVLAARLAAAAIPTDGEFKLEETAALALGKARREFWKVWRACKTTDVDGSPQSRS
jgi:hypothetical protein